MLISRTELARSSGKRSAAWPFFQSRSYASWYVLIVALVPPYVRKRAAAIPTHAPTIPAQTTIGKALMRMLSHHCERPSWSVAAVAALYSAPSQPCSRASVPWADSTESRTKTRRESVELIKSGVTRVSDAITEIISTHMKYSAAIAAKSITGTFVNAPRPHRLASQIEGLRIATWSFFVIAEITLFDDLLSITS